MRDVTILMDSAQGVPARLLSELAEAGVEIEAGCLFPRLEGRVMHLTVADHEVDQVRDAAASVGATMADDRECVVVPPGYGSGLADTASKIASTGATVQVAYYGRDGQIILATNELEQTRQSLGL
jgi:hypothetical protein